MTLEELEKEVLSLKDKLSFWRGAFIAGTALLLGWMSVQSFVQIPAKVEDLLEDKAGKDIEAKDAKINAAAENLDQYLVTLLDGRRILLEVGATGFQPDNRFVGFRPEGQPGGNFQNAEVHVGGGGGDEILTIRVAK